MKYSSYWLKSYLENTDHGINQSSAVPQKGLHTEHEPESTPDDLNSPSPARLRSPKQTNLSDSNGLCRGEINLLTAHKKAEWHISLGYFN